MHRFFIFYMALVLFGTVLFLGYNFMYFTAADFLVWNAESGPIENATALLFGIVSVLAVGIAFREQRKIWWLFAFFMVTATCRELDLHKAFTQDSVLKMNFYTKSDAPIIEKMGGGLFVAILMTAIIQLLMYAKQWVLDVLKFKPMPLAAFLAIGMLGFAKTLDAMARLFPISADFHDQYRAAIGLVEETFELSSAAMFLCVCLLWFRTNRLLR